MRLPIPFESGGRTVDEIELETPRAGVLADTQRAAEGGKLFTALSVLLAGVIAGEGNAKSLARDIPYRDAEWMALQAILRISPDDGFEGVYTCPRCGAQMICELTEDEDSRDFVKDLEVVYRDEPGLVEIELTEPVVFTSKGEEIDRVTVFEMRYPTLEDCIKAEARGQKGAKQQFAIYAQAIETVNGKQINSTWKAAYGPLVFERMTISDVMKVSRAMAEYGLESEVERVCHSCGKVWKAPVDTSNFFASALRSV